MIVRIRRGIDVSTNWSTFSWLWEHEFAYLCETLNSRWLISALDTYADCGHSLQQARALIQIAFFNTLRLAETERALLSDNSVVQEVFADVQKQKMRHLWDGISTYNLQRGDMVWNMLARIRRCLGPDPILSAIFETLLARALQHDTLISRTTRISDHSRKEAMS